MRLRKGPTQGLPAEAQKPPLVLEALLVPTWRQLEMHHRQARVLGLGRGEDNLPSLVC